MAEEDDNMYDEADGEDDDEKALQEALALSMVPDAAEAAQQEQQPVADPEPAQEEKHPDVNIDADFMKGVIGDLGIDIDQSQLEEMVNEAKNDKDKKDDDKDKDMDGDEKK